LSVTHVEQALQRQVIHGGDLATNLLELSMIDEVVLADYLGRVVRMPVYPAEYLLSVDPGVIKMIPWQVANDRRVVPVRVHGDTMVVAAAGPVPKGALDEVSFLLGVEVVPNLVVEFRLAMALNRYYGIPMPARMAALQRKLSPDFVPDQRPVVPPTTGGISLITPGAAPATPPPAVEKGPQAARQRPDVTDRVVVESSRTARSRDEESTLKFITGTRDSTNRFLSVWKAGEEMEDRAAAEASFAPAPAAPAVELDREATVSEAPDGVQSDPAGGEIHEGITSIPAPQLVRRSTALEMLDRSTGRDEIIEVFLGFASQAFEFSVLLVVHGRTAQGRHLVARGGPVLPAEFISVPLDAGGMFEAVHTTCGYHLGPPGTTAVEEDFFRVLGREEPRSCALIPVVLRGRVLMLFYGDSGQRGVKANRVANLADFVRSVSGAFERLLLRQKYGQYTKKTEGEKAAGKVLPEQAKPESRRKDFSAWAAADDAIGAAGWPEPARSSIPSPAAPPEVPGRSEEEPDAVATSPTVPAPDPESCGRGGDQPVSQPRPAQPPVRMIPPAVIVSPPAPRPPEPASRGAVATTPSVPCERVTEPAPADAEIPERTWSVSNPDPELVRRVETIVVRTSPSFEPSDTSTKKVVDIAEISRASSARGAGVASDPSAAPEPGHDVRVPPSTVASGSVRIEMPEEIERLVERVVTRGSYDQVAADLLVGIGDDAIRELVRHFPGPLNYDRYQETARLRKVGQHGPLLKTLNLFGKRAGPHLVPLLDGFDSEMRFYAVFLFSEIDYPEALSSLSRRLFDNDRQIRVLAMDVMRRFASYPEYRWAVQETAAILTSSSSSLEKKRMAAEALGELQDPVAIRALAEMLGSVDGVLAERCQRALVRITFNDFGFSERRWLAWWQANRNQHRIEWAVNSMNHRVEDIRRAAVDELRRMVGGAVEWPRGPLDHKQRREVRRRCLQWWEREGRALHPVVEYD